MPEAAPLTRLALLSTASLALVLAGCSATSGVAELAPETFGLTAHGNTPAAAVALGVAQAQRHCAAMGRDFEVTRSEIGGRDYTIAFRCPRPEAAAPGSMAQGAMPFLAPLPEAEPRRITRAPGSRSRGTAPSTGGVPGTAETF